jgi:uncharacterized membrane protein
LGHIRRTVSAWRLDISLFGDKRAVHIAVGVAVVVLALIAGFGGVKLGSYHQRTQQQREESASRLGNRLFFPALAIPVVTVIGVLMFNHIPGWQDALFGPGNHATLVTLFSMTAGSLIGLAMAIKMTHERVRSRCRRRAVCWTPSAGRSSCRRFWRRSGCCLRLRGGGISYLTQEYLAVDSRLSPWRCTHSAWHC